MFEFPMLCNSSKESSLSEVDWTGYVVEPKFDGARAIISATEEGVKIYSRSGREFTEHLPHIVESLSGLPLGTTLDGEVALVSHLDLLLGKQVAYSNFNRTMRVLGSLPERGRRLQEEKFGRLSFLAFDILSIGEDSCKEEPFESRRGVLESLGEFEYFILSPVWEATCIDLSKFFLDIVESGGEGIVLKKKTAKYIPGKRPARNQYKVKVTREADVVITGFKPGTGKYSDQIGSINFGRWTPEGVVYVGRCSGMTDKERKWFTENQEELIGTVMTISYNEKVGSKEYRSPRHPQFVRLRDPADKKPEECDGYEFLNKE